jgi:glyoxylase-like metal-dependent hydrolase (beta-lactamase superfamily II)
MCHDEKSLSLSFYGVVYVFGIIQSIHPANPLRVFSPMYQELIKNQLYNLTGLTIVSDGYSLNTFALILNQRVLLLDAILPETFGAVLELLRDHPDWKIVGCLISHRHVPKLARKQGLTQFLATFGQIPLILPEFESQNEDAQRSLPDGVAYLDPIHSNVVQEFGIDITKFPGHTEAHPMYHWKPLDVLFTGDCAAGPTSENGFFSRPSAAFSWNDTMLQEAWKNYLSIGIGNIRTICPSMEALLWTKIKRR